LISIRALSLLSNRFYPYWGHVLKLTFLVSYLEFFDEEDPKMWCECVTCERKKKKVKRRRKKEEDGKKERKKER